MLDPSRCRQRAGQFFPSRDREEAVVLIALKGHQRTAEAKRHTDVVSAPGIEALFATDPAGVAQSPGNHGPAWRDAVGSFRMQPRRGE
jgi:hypothetical protein